MMDNGGTTGEGGRWLSYAELAELRGITRKAAARLTLRHGWRRQPGNDGATRVLVPPDIERRQTPRGDGPPTPPSDSAAILAVWRERAEVAERRADQADADRRQAEAARQAAETRADHAEQGREAERERAHELANRMLVAQGAADRAEAEAGELRRQAEAAQAARAEAEANAEELRQAEAVRQGRGRLARLRAAWRGE
jgi:hypothetical protein